MPHFFDVAVPKPTLRHECKPHFNHCLPHDAFVRLVLLPLLLEWTRRPATGWPLPLNLKNVFDNDSIVRLKISPAGELMSYRFNPPREWVLTSRFTF